MIKLNIEIKKQKDYECLSACLKAVLAYYNIDILEEEIIEKISTDSMKLYDWEFKAGKLAIENGLKVEVHSNVGQILSPSWYNLSQDDLIKKVEEEMQFFVYRSENFEKDPKLLTSMCPHKLWAERLTKDVRAMLDFLKIGGVINFSPISKDLISQKLMNDTPVIISHDAAILHRMSRYGNGSPDDVKGDNWGHVVVISGDDGDNFLISDPAGMFYENKFVYSVDKDLLLESILRYNGQLLVISK